jgi:hypothetical protein
MSNIDGFIKVLSDDINKKGKAGDWKISNVKCQCGKIPLHGHYIINMNILFQRRQNGINFGNNQEFFAGFKISYCCCSMPVECGKQIQLGIRVGYDFAINTIWASGSVTILQIIETTAIYRLLV